MSSTSVARFAPLLLVAACAHNLAPGGFLPPPKDAGKDLYGGWIELVVPAGRQDTRIAGELIAARGDTVWILPDTGQGVIAVATSTVKQARLVGYRSDAGAVMGYTALGILSTLSNGAFLVLTAPAWLITGIVASSAESKTPIRDTPPHMWGELAAYARFPEGLPLGIDLAEIRPKPGARKAAAPNP
ncbi:MAG TPA: hypothetical protein VL563_00910 [Gemmatimonadales bacterium]|nr:hypothetical protein [Gemmatimonadales bacterium]